MGRWSFCGGVWGGGRRLGKDPTEPSDRTDPSDAYPRRRVSGQGNGAPMDQHWHCGTPSEHSPPRAATQVAGLMGEPQYEL